MKYLGIAILTIQLIVLIVCVTVTMDPRIEMPPDLRLWILFLSFVNAGGFVYGLVDWAEERR